MEAILDLLDIQMPSPPLVVEDIINAFMDLGGKASWQDVETQIMSKRDGHTPYQNVESYKKMMFQLVQQHCVGYAKFKKGDVLFEKLKKGQFCLVHCYSPPEDIHPETISSDRQYITGAVRQVLINAYERDFKARAKCICHQGVRCVVCDLSFEERYGIIGKGFIHIHHLKPLSSREVYCLDPINDLVPVCPNCHSMLHSCFPPLSVEELKEKIRVAATI